MTTNEQNRLQVLEAREEKRRIAAKKCAAKKAFVLSEYKKFFETKATQAEKSQLRGQLANI